MGRQVFGHLQASRAPSCVTWDLEKQMPSLWMSPFPSSTPSFMCWAWHHVVGKIPSVSLGSAVPAVPPLSFFCTSSLTGGAAGEAEVLRLCKHCLEICKTRGCCQHCFGQKSRTQHHTVYCEDNSILAKTYSKLNSGFYFNYLIYFLNPMYFSYKYIA